MNRKGNGGDDGAGDEGGPVDERRRVDRNCLYITHTHTHIDTHSHSHSQCMPLFMPLTCHVHGHGGRDTHLST